MDLDSVKSHWQDWATRYGTSLRATTKTATAKAVEIDALVRALRHIESDRGGRLAILEVGCGNGLNCLSLVDAFPEATFLGLDLIAEMIAAANALKAARGIPDRVLRFEVGNVLDLAVPMAAYDVVFTDRCLINLHSDALQRLAIAALAERLKPGGHLLMIENSRQTYAAQNEARERVGLPARKPAEFNRFFDEATILPFLPSAGLDLVEIEDFISLHDLVLYVLVPMTNGGVVDYDHPLVEAATRLNIALSAQHPGGLGQYGQNRLFKCRKRAQALSEVQP